MKTLTVQNDHHLGAERSGGTTPLTKWKLRQDLLKGFGKLLDRVDSDLLINGDLLDTHSIAYADLLETLRLLQKWLAKGHNLYLSMGNHDLSKNVNTLGSFGFLIELLEQMYPAQVVGIKEPTAIPEHDAYVIPHLQNQDLFDAALKAVPKCRVLFLHCNFNNGHAEQADHSLNVSESQAEAAPVDFIVFGHEHQRKSALKGKVIVVGNQLPSSVADCLGNDAKYMLKIGEVIEHIPVWEAEGDFSRQDWRELKDTGARFIRVEGDATPEEAADAVSRISKFRAKSEALVITNAVKIGNADDQAKLVTSLEAIQGFNVREALFKILTVPQRKIVEGLIKEYSV